MHFLIKSILPIALLMGVFALQGQESTWKPVEVDGKNISRLQVNLYRGKIEVYPSQSGDFEIETTAFDFDRHEKKGRYVSFSKSSAQEQVQVTEKEGTLRLFNELSREIIGLRIGIPEAVELAIEVEHFGEVTTKALEAEIEVILFKGFIALAEVQHAVNLHIARDGAIKVDFNQIPEATYSAVSIYDGAIGISLPEAPDLKLKASTDQGKVIDNLGQKWTEFEAKEFEEKDSSGKSRKKRGIIKTTQMGKGSAQLTLRNIRGDIGILIPRKK